MSEARKRDRQRDAFMVFQTLFLGVLTADFFELLRLGPWADALWFLFFVLMILAPPWPRRDKQ